MNLDTKETKIAYIAGLVDGEGCIFISRANEKRPNRQKVYYAFSIIIAMKNPSALRFVQANYGGRLDTKVSAGHKEYYDRRYWRLTLCSNNALKLLKDILPYLLVKVSSAKIAIEFQEHLNTCLNPRARALGGKSYFERVFSEREKIYQRYRAAAETERESGLKDRVRCDSPLLQDDKL